MNTPRKPSYNALLRKIERLEAQVVALTEQLEMERNIHYGDLRARVDLKVRAEQAVRLLQGADE